MIVLIIKFIFSVLKIWFEGQAWKEAMLIPRIIVYILGEFVTFCVIISGLYFYTNFMKLKREAMRLDG